MFPEGNERYRLKEHLLLRVFEDGGIVFDLDSRACHEINHAAGRMLQYLSGEYGLDTVAATLAAESEESVDAVKRDLLEFIDHLVEKSWVDIQP
jgi:hypothetical protein